MHIAKMQQRRPPANPVYTFGIDDVLEIKFFDHSQFNEILKVRPDGKISLAKIDEIFVLGMTPMQLDNLITAAYAKIIQKPDVTVIVREFGERHVYVLGEVHNPGGYALQRDMTLLHSIAAAGGFLPSAELKSVMILRRINRQTITAVKINAAQSFTNQFTAASGNPFVYAMDIVYVPRTYIASARDFLDQLYDIVLPPFDVYLRALWYTSVLD